MNIPSRPVPTRVSVRVVGAGASNITVPVRGVLTDVDEAHSTVKEVDPAVSMLCGVRPSGAVGLEHALPIGDVGVFQSKLNGSLDVQVIDSGERLQERQCPFREMDSVEREELKAGRA